MKTLLLVASLSLAGCADMFAPDGWWTIEPEPAWREDFATLIECAGAYARQTNFDRINFRATYDLPDDVLGSQIGRWDVYLDANVLADRDGEPFHIQWAGASATMTLREYVVRHELLHVVLDRRGHHYPFSHCIGL